MNFLQLVQRLRLESGIGTGVSVTSVTSSTDRDTQRMVGWIGDAWRDLQQLPHNWRWMKREIFFETQPAVWRLMPTDLNPVIEFARVDRSGKRKVRASTIPDDWTITAAVDGLAIAAMPPGQTWPLEYLSPDEFHSRFGHTLHTAGMPQFWTEDTDGAILLGPTPDTAYAIRLPYVRAPHVMTANTDTPGVTTGLNDGAGGYDDGPGMPAQHHMAIVWLALWQYGAFDSAPEVTARAKVNYNAMLSALIADQGEQMTWV